MGHLRLALVLSLTLLLVYSCRRTEDYSRYERAIRVETLSAESTESVVRHTYIGEVAEVCSWAMSFPTGGKITQVFVSPNARVKKGERLAAIDDTQQQNALQTARAALRQAEDGYERLKQVYEQGAVAEVKWVEIQTELQKAKALADAAQQSADDCILRAPQDAIVSKCELQAGQQLAPGQPALWLMDVEAVKIVFAVPETEVAGIRVGDSATVEVAALGNMQFKGRVTEKSMTANRLSHTYSVSILLANENGSLLPGMVCKVALEKERRSGFIVPARCVHTRKEGTAVWVVDEIGTAHRRQVETIAFAGKGVLIASGLHAGDKVVVAGYQKLYEGAKTTEEE